MTTARCVWSSPQVEWVDSVQDLRTRQSGVVLAAPRALRAGAGLAVMASLPFSPSLTSALSVSGAAGGAAPSSLARGGGIGGSGSGGLELPGGGGGDWCMEIKASDVQVRAALVHGCKLVGLLAKGAYQAAAWQPRARRGTALSDEPSSPRPRCARPARRRAWAKRWRRRGRGVRRHRGQPNRSACALWLRPV
jgi:hypothetical protein